MNKLRLLDLFSGIGGFSLGLERSGYFITVAFCEIEPFPRRVLKKHWPDVKIYEDVRTLNAATFRRDGIGVDAICGGFPCQDISVAGKGAGIEGERSGLWSEYARIIRELRPRLVIVENVAALLGRGLERVLGDLAALGFDAEWHCIPASAVGAPHRRDRLWILANAAGQVSDRHSLRAPPEHSVSRSGSKYVANSQISRLEGWSNGGDSGPILSRSWENGWPVINQWFIEPDVGRVANGVPSRVHRLKCLGNAVVPQIPELIGRAIGEVMERSR